MLALSLLAPARAAAPIELKGVRSCDNWVAEKRLAQTAKEMNKVAVLITKSWFLGYLSGRADNSGKDFLKGTDSDSIFLWLDNYCRDNPQAKLDQAGLALARELAQLKGIKP